MQKLNASEITARQSSSRNGAMKPPEDSSSLLAAVAPGDADRDFGVRFRIDRDLLAGDRGRGLQGGPEDDGHAGAQATQDAAGIVCAGAHSSILDAVGVVILRAAAVRACKAAAELDALHSGDAEDRPGDAVFHSVEHGPAEAGGAAGDRAFNDAAHAVALGTRSFHAV